VIMKNKLLYACVAMALAACFGSPSSHHGRTTRSNARFLASPFGTTLNQASARYTFTGQERNARLAWLDFSARQYRPEWGRFAQADPVFQAGISPYAYVQGRPLTQNDPSGNTPQDVKQAPEKQSSIGIRYPNWPLAGSGLAMIGGLMLGSYANGLKATTAAFLAKERGQAIVSLTRYLAVTKPYFYDTHIWPYYHFGYNRTGIIRQQIVAEGTQMGTAVFKTELQQRVALRWVSARYGSYLLWATAIGLAGYWAYSGTEATTSKEWENMAWGLGLNGAAVAGLAYAGVTGFFATWVAPLLITAIPLVLLTVPAEEFVKVPTKIEMELIAARAYGRRETPVEKHFTRKLEVLFTLHHLKLRLAETEAKL